MFHGEKQKDITLFYKRPGSEHMVYFKHIVHVHDVVMGILKVPLVHR